MNLRHEVGITWRNERSIYLSRRRFTGGTEIGEWEGVETIQTGWEYIGKCIID